MREKVVGILGGMGPESTADFFLRVIKATPAKRDQEHLRIIVDNNPKIPDRTLALLTEDGSILEDLRGTLRNLVKAGAEIIAMPCNTAHHYYDELQSSIDIPIVNMISETAKYIESEFPSIKKIGLLATTGTIETGIYHKAIKKEIGVIMPDEDGQKGVMSVIYGEWGIKAGYTYGDTRREMQEVAETLVKRGAEAIIMGCTEISLVLKQENISVPLIDPLQILAEVIVKKARQME